MKSVLGQGMRGKGLIPIVLIFPIYDLLNKSRTGDFILRSEQAVQEGQSQAAWLADMG